ncbi:hypothetical protein BANRA_04081 [Pseudomonas aeruginosa]|nr:hypothetical protein BANRA_04081 [Pseudomonas aeruginosa]
MINNYVITITNGSKKLCTLLIGKYRSICPLVDVFVGSDGYEQSINHRAGALQMINMPRMNYVKTAMTKTYYQAFFVTIISFIL